MSRKILFSLAMIAFAGAVIVGATGAFFSDTETSTGNTFTAGAIDLTIDSTATYNGSAWATSTWAMKNLVPTSDKFFNFDDVKPGDRGTNVISLHVANNDAYACLDINNLHNDGNGLTEPEDAVDNDADGAGQGELAQNLDFFAWVDLDGDGVFEPTAEVKLFSQTSGIGQASDVLNGKTYTLADSTTAPMASNTTRFIGLAWCAGDMTVDLGTGTIACSGALMGNESQTDSVTADLSFRVEQSRNNTGFVCTAPTNGETSQKVGAKLSAYSAPTCDATVSSGESIQDAINNAGITTGKTVCVGDGTYTQNVDVNKSITLASVNGSALATLNGRVRVSAAGASVKGLTILGATVTGEGVNGIYVVNGSNNLMISDNVIDGDSQTSGQRIGVHFEVGGTTGVTVTNNVIKNWDSTGLYLNPTAGPVSITYNDFSTNNVGIGSSGPNNVTVSHNDFVGNIAEAIGMDDTSPVSGIAININNFTPAGVGNNVNSYGGLTSANATNNWWDSEAVGDRTNDQTDIDVTSPASTAFAQN